MIARTLPLSKLCLTCGSTFKPTDHGHVFCSRACYFINKRHKPMLGACVFCGKEFTRRNGQLRRRFCSRKCGAVRLPLVTCLVCGVQFHPKRTIQASTGLPPRFCGVVCSGASRRNTPEQLRMLRARKNTARRLRLSTVRVERIDPISVFERDEWRCYLCGELTLSEERGNRRHPKAPVLDHVIPLALGGDHVMSNLRCACNFCNTSKGARLVVDNP